MKLKFYDKARSWFKITITIFYHQLNGVPCYTINCEIHYFDPPTTDILIYDPIWILNYQTQRMSIKIVWIEWPCTVSWMPKDAKGRQIRKSYSVYKTTNIIFKYVLCTSKTLQKTHICLCELWKSTIDSKSNHQTIPTQNLIWTNRSRKNLHTTLETSPLLRPTVRQSHTAHQAIWNAHLRVEKNLRADHVPPTRTSNHANRSHAVKTLTSNAGNFQITLTMWRTHRRRHPSFQYTAKFPRIRSSDTFLFFFFGESARRKISLL